MAYVLWETFGESKRCTYSQEMIEKLYMSKPYVDAAAHLPNLPSSLSQTRKFEIGSYKLGIEKERWETEARARRLNMQVEHGKEED
jgi:hypothetical protein